MVGTKGRKPRITEAMKLAISREYWQGTETQVEIAQRYGVGVSSVHKAIYAYKNLPRLTVDKEKQMCREYWAGSESESEIARRYGVRVDEARKAIYGHRETVEKEKDNGNSSE